MNSTKLGFKNLLPILFILLIGGIGVQSLTSCSSGKDDDTPPGSGSADDPNTATYTGTDGGTAYTLKITKGTGNPVTPPGGGNSTLNGTWVNSAEGLKLVLDNGSFTMSENDIEKIKGTYSPSGSNLNLTPTQVSGAGLGSDASTFGLSATQWYSKEQLRAAIIQTIVNLGYSQSEAEAVYNETPTLSGAVNELFAPQTGQYTLNSNTLTLTAWGGTSTLTRSGVALRSIPDAYSALYAAQVGDGYLLNVTSGGTTRASSGTVTTTAASTLTLTPTGGTTAFNVTVNTTGGITSINGPITFDNGETITVNSAVTPGTGGGDGKSSSSGGGGSCNLNGRSVTIGTQVWMAENLNCDVSGSKCYDDDPANCAKYGRLYDWETAKTVCPSGWHLPSNDDWNELLRWVDERNGNGNYGYGDGGGCIYGSYKAGRYLKVSSGWFSDGNGTDEYGFSALPGGGDGYNENAGERGYWWSSSKSDIRGDHACGLEMSYKNEHVVGSHEYKSSSFSVRCVQD